MIFLSNYTDVRQVHHEVLDCRNAVDGCAVNILILSVCVIVLYHSITFFACALLVLI